MTTTYSPTPEQQACVDLALRGDDCVIEAYAGTGKTATLVAVADAILAAKPTTRILYVAFNKAIVTEAETRFDPRVTCKTAHGLAWRPIVGASRAYKARLRAPRMKAQDLARHLRVQPADLVLHAGRRQLAAGWIATQARRTVDVFCQTGDSEVKASHVPQVELPVKDDNEARAARKVIVDAVLPVARRYWSEVVNENGGVPFLHDHYLKLFQLDASPLPFDVILYDEAQDTNGCMAGIIEAQPASVQRIYVGDTYQQIYAWRGAINALSGFSGERAMLTKSFRFGPDIAALGSAVIVDLLGAPKPLTGNENMVTEGERTITADTLNDPDAVLCRTNAEVMSRLIAAIDANVPAAVVGGTGELVRFCEGAADLQAGRRTSYHELACFESWAEVVSTVEDDDGGATELRVMVRAIEKHGVVKLLGYLRSAVSEDQATLILSTAHKAKGREWDRVTLAGDFAHDNGKRPPTTEDHRLLYVSVTRARRMLDVSLCEAIRPAAEALGLVGVPV